MCRKDVHMFLVIFCFNMKFQKVQKDLFIRRKNVCVFQKSLRFVADVLDVLLK